MASLSTPSARQISLALILLLISGSAVAQQFTISTYAGAPAPASGTALNISVGFPKAIVADASGNAYFATLNAVYKVDTGGNLTRVAGTGRAGFSGDGGAATTALIAIPDTSPAGLALDGSGNLYIADSFNQRIRKVTSAGIISTVAGNGNCCNINGDGGTATSASLWNPTGVAVDGSGTIYIADSSNQRIRMVSGGVITTIAGTGTAGFAGDNAAATSAQLSNPTRVAVDAAGSVYILDANNDRIRKITAGIITTVAGTGAFGFSGDGSAATAAQLNRPSDIAVDNATPANLYIADSNNERIRKVTGATGVISTVAGTGVYGNADGSVSTATFSNFLSVAVDTSGRIYIADAFNFRVRKLVSGTVSPLAGNGVYYYNGDGIAATAAQIGFIRSLTLDSANNLYVADPFNYRIRKVSSTDGTITTYAGTGVCCYSGDAGQATSAQINFPASLTFDTTGNLYFTDQNDNVVRKIAANGLISTVAGINGSPGFSGDSGAATSAQLQNPIGLAVDASGNLYIADTGNHRIRKVTGTTITTVAGTGTSGFFGDGGQAINAQFNLPSGLAFDSAGNLYVSDANNFRIRKITASGVISTYAGNGICCGSGDGGLATNAQIQSPTELRFDAAGNLYFADYHASVRVVLANGIINTLAGSNTVGHTGDGGPASSALLQETTGVAVDATGSIYAGSYDDGEIRYLALVPLAITTPQLPNAFNGTPYSTQLGATGGHPPYTWTLTGGTLPTGINVSTSGLVAGSTTQLVSNQGVTFKVTDSFSPAANVSTTGDTITVANPVPSVNSIVPYVALAGTPSLTVTVNGSGFVNGVSSVLWNASPRSTTFVNANQLTATLTAGDLASVATNMITVTNGAPGGGTSAGAAFTVATPCAYGLSQTQVSAAIAGSTGSINVLTGAGCSWTAVSNNGFITINSGASSSGIGVVTYTVAVNAGASRTGTLTIAGQTVTVNQNVVSGPQFKISTFAGNPTPPLTVAALSANLGNQQSLAIDSSGNVYMAVPALNSVFKLDVGGTVSRIAGNGTAGFSGDGFAATSAQLYGPQSVAVDGFGNVFVTDTSNARIRKIAPNGIITTVAGNGCCFGGDGGPATSAQLNFPEGIALDTAGNIYFADNNNSRIRKVTVSTGIITTIAGTGINGYSGDNGVATNAQVNSPRSVAVDSSGNVYIADSSNNRIRKITGTTITTIAGTGACCYQSQFDHGAATSAQLNLPTSVAVSASGDVYIGDNNDDRILMVANGTGLITTVAGNGVYGYSGDGGAATSAQITNSPSVALDSSGNLYIGDGWNHIVRKVTGGIINTIAGSGNSNFGGDGGPAASALLSQPQPVAIDLSGNIVIPDFLNSRIRKVTNGTISTIAGISGFDGRSGDGGAATSARLGVPRALSYDAAGNLYYADQFINVIRKITPGGIISAIGGGNGSGFGGDGNAATSALISNPQGLVSDAAGNVYFSDTGNQRVRKISTGGIITTIAGNGTFGYTGNGGQATSAALASPEGLALDTAGNLYIAEASNHVVRMVNLSSGVISLVAGNNSCCFSGDGGLATSAQLNFPTAVAVDAAGNLYIADQNNQRVRLVTGGIISTIAGGNGIGYFGDGGLATSAQLTVPDGLAMDAAGNIYVSDPANNTVRMLSPLALGLTVPSPLPGGFVTQPYSYTLTSDGGHPPYTWTIASGSLPGSLGLSSAGVISGTPGATGTFSFTVKATDSLGVTATASTSITVNVPAPMISSLTPYFAQTGNAGFTLNVRGTGFVSGSSTIMWGNSARATTFISTSQLSTPISAGDLASAGTTNVTVVNATPGGGTSSAAPFIVGACGYLLSSTSSLSASLAGETASVSVIAPVGCAWTAASNSGFITVNSGASGSGLGTVNYTVAADTGAGRTGTMTIAGITFTVTQSVVSGPQYTISTVAGGNAPPMPAVALNSNIGSPGQVAVDKAGNVYFNGFNAIYRVDALGGITLFAGTTIAGYGGDGGPAVNAQLNGNSGGLVFDTAGNLYVSDTNNNRVRKITPAGFITTFAGNGNCCFGGDGNAAVTAQMSAPQGLAFDAAGNLYIADTNNNRVRMVTTGGIISTVAGNGTNAADSGDSGAATSAVIQSPRAVALDASNNLYIGTQTKVRKVTSGTISTVAGNGTCCYSGDGGAATSAAIQNPQAIFVDGAGTVYLADSSNRIRTVTGGVISTFAGSGICCVFTEGGKANSVFIGAANGMTFDAAGNLFYADGGQNRIRKIAAGTLTTTTLAGNGGYNYGGDGALGTAAQLGQPSSVALDSAGNLYIADQLNSRIRKVALNGNISTVVGGSSIFQDGVAATNTTLGQAEGIAFDAAGNMYIADTFDSRIRMVNTSGVITTVAGNGNLGNSGDGALAINAQLGRPAALAVDSAGNVYFSDTNSNVVRKFTVGGNISTVAGTGTGGYSGDGVAATTSQLNQPHSLAFDASNNLYIADSNNLRVRKVAAGTGIITTVAGNGTCCASGDGGQATAAQIASPEGVAVDARGYLYIADTANRIRVVAPGGIISTIAGAPFGYAGDGGPALSASLEWPFSLAIKSDGKIFVADIFNNAVRLLTPTALAIPAITLTPTPNGAFAGQLTAIGGLGSYTYAIINGNLPAGLNLNTSTGAITGNTGAAGTSNFTLQVTDGAGTIVTANLSMNVQFPGLSITTGANLGVPSIGYFENALAATGGNGTYAWSVTNGSTLPPGCTLRTDFPLSLQTFANGTSGNLSCVLTTPGNYSFNLTVTSATQTASQTFTMKVSALRIKDGYTMPDAFVGVAYAGYTPTAIANAGNVTWTFSNIPPGMSGNATTGALTGTPTTAGTYSVGYTLSDGVDSESFGNTINVFQVQITTPPQLPTATQFLPYSTTVTASGGSGSYTWTSNTMPSGLSLNASTGVISGTPNGGAGRAGFNLTATDTNHVAYTQTVAIPIIGAPKHLAQLNVGSFDDCSLGARNYRCVHTINAQFGGTPNFTWSATGLPSWLSIRTGTATSQPSLTPGDAELWGTADAVGTYPIQVTMTDSDGNNSIQTFPLVVSPLFVETYFANGTRATAYSSTLRAVGGIGPYTLTQVGGVLPAGLTLNGFVLSGTPTENGNFFANWRIQDSASHTFNISQTISIANVSGSTVSINNGSNLGTAVQNSSYSTTLSACCVSSYTWSLVGGTLPTGINLSAGGVLAGTPTVAGTYTFLVQVADAQNSSNTGRRQFMLVVAPLNQTLSSITAFGNVNTFYTQTLTVTGNSGTTTWSLAPFNYLPPGITLTSAGLLSGTPTQPGYFSFVVNLTDSTNVIVQRTYTVQILPQGVNPPLALNFGPTIGPNVIGVQTFQLPASGGTPPYHYSYTPSATPIPGMRVLDGAPLPTSFPSTIGGSLAGVILTPGVYTTSLRITDSTNTTFDRPVTWTVLNIAPLAQASLPKATANTAYSFTFPGFGGGGTYSWSATGLPAGITMNSSTGTISGSPTATGTFSSVAVTITDLSNNLAINYTGLTLIVNPFAITAPATLPQGLIGTAYSQTLTAPNCGTGCTWTLAAGNLPGGLTLSSAGVLSGTPNAFYNSAFLAQAAGSAGTTQKELAVLINFNTIQPLFISTNAAFGPNFPNNVVANPLTAQGGTPPYTWTLQSGNLPPGVSLTGPGETLGANLFPGFTYLAGRVMQAGTYSFTLKVTDSASGTPNTTTKAFTWTVAPVSFNITTFPPTSATQTYSTLVYNAAYSQQLLVIGGSGSYTNWQIASGILPPGLNINASTGVVSGTPTNTGGFSPQLQVTDSLGNTVTQTVNFNVSTATGAFLNAGNPDTVTMAAGNTTLQSFTPSGGTGPYTFAPVTALPPGCVFEYGNTILSNNTNTYALVCNPLAPGSFPFTFQITDAVGNIGYRTMTLNVSGFTLFSSTSLPNGSLNSAYSTTLTTWDNTGTVTWTLQPGSILPPGLNLTGNVLSGSPTAAGAYSFVLAASDGGAVTTNFTFSLTVSTLNITTADIIPQQVISFVPYSFGMTATGPGTITWSATGLPSGITMSSTTGVLSGTTTTNTETFRITVTVTNGSSTYVHTFTLFVHAQDPSLPSFLLTGTAIGDIRVGQNFSFALSPTGGTPPYTWTVANGSSLPPGLNLVSGTTQSAYGPTQSVGLTILEGAPTVANAYSFDLIATDVNGLQLRRTFTLNVSPITIISGALRNAIVGTAYSEQLQVAGGTGPYNFTYASVLGFDMVPPGVNISPSGLISGTATSTGQFQFVATAHDSAGHTFTSTYSWFATNSFNTYVATNVSLGSRAGSGFSVTLSASVTSGNTSAYSWSVSNGSLPPGLQLNPNGTTTQLNGPPLTAGTYTYTLRATDFNNSANFAERVYTLVIQATQGITHRLATFPPATVGVAYSYTLTMAGGTAPYTYAIPAVLQAAAPLPAGLHLSSAGVLSGTPTQSGVYSFDFQVTDANNNVGVFGSSNLPVLPPSTNFPLLGTSATFANGSIGTPYVAPLDPTASGGVPPYTWSVANGSTLPPGLTIQAGTNGISSYLTGIPTVLGGNTFSLNVTDSVGKNGTVIGNLFVSAIAVTHASQLIGTVGQPFSMNFNFTGGTPPYSIDLTASSGIVPGVTTYLNGVLSGTPTQSGTYSVTAVVTDSAATPNSINFSVLVTIDDAQSQAPGIAMNPAAVQMSYVLTAPAPPPAQIVLPVTSTPLPFTAFIGGIPGASLSATSGTAPATLNINLDPNALSAGTYSGVVAISSPQSLTGYNSVPVTLTVLNPPPCNYALSPTGGSVVAAGGTGSFSVTTGGLCSWTPTPSDPWITITGGSGPGSGSVSYSLAANVGLSARNGSISAGGQTYAITQFGSSCSLAINPSNISVTAAGGQAQVNVTASNGACGWTASGLSAAPVSGTGNGSVTLTIPSTSNSASGVLTATVAGQTVTVNQSGIACFASLDSTSAGIVSAGGSGAIHVTTPNTCSYNTINGPSWISVTAGASGSGPGPVELDYTVAANSTTTARVGSLNIGGTLFTIAQDATPCSVTIDASGLGSPFGSAGGSGSVGIITNGANCSWTASSSSSWAGVTPTSGVGSGTVNVTAGSNANSATPRATTLTIAGQTIGLLEAGTTCTYALGSTTASVPYAGGSGAVRVAAPGVCSWTSSTDVNAPWLTISSSGTGGTANVSFVATPNTTAASRTGTLTIAGQSYTVTQGAAPCNYQFNLSNNTVAAAGASSSFTYTTSAQGCTATPQSYANWLTVSATGDGTSGTVNYTATANPSGATRSATIQFAGQNFTVNQTGAACAYSLTSYGALLSMPGGTGNVAGSPSAQGCTPTYGTDQPSIVTLGALAGPTSNVFTLPYTVNPFNSVSTAIRRFTITFGGQIYVIKQTSW